MIPHSTTESHRTDRIGWLRAAVLGATRLARTDWARPPVARSRFVLPKSGAAGWQ